MSAADLNNPPTFIGKPALIEVFYYEAPLVAAINTRKKPTCAITSWFPTPIM